MIRALGAAMAAGGLLVKGAVGFAGFILVVGWIAPRAPESAPRSGADGPSRSGSTVVLKIPEGRPAGELAVVDASGRVLATLTHWSDGRSAIMTPRGAGASVGCFRGADGSVRMLVSGREGEVEVEIDRDGRTTASPRDPSHFINPPKSRSERDGESRPLRTNPGETPDDDRQSGAASGG